MVAMMLPMLIGLAVFQINAFFDSVIAYALSPRNGGPDTFHLFGMTLAYPTALGDVAALNWSQRLYQFPLGVFGIAIATAIFPALSHAAADTTDAGRDQFLQTLRRGLRLTVFIGLPASVGLILVGVPLTRLIFEYRQFTTSDAHRVAAVLAGYASGVWAYSMMHVITRAFYALKDARTPLRIAMAMVVLNLALNLTFVWMLGVAALAWATAVTAMIQVLILTRSLARTVHGPVDHTVWRSWRRTAILTAAMAVAMTPLVMGYRQTELSRLASAQYLLAMLAVGLIVFLGAAWWCGAEELRWLIRRRTSD